MEEPKTPSNTDRLNELLEQYQKDLNERTLLRDLLNEEIKKSQAIIKDVRKVAEKYRSDLNTALQSDSNEKV